MKPKISIIICSIDAGKFAQISESYRHLMADHSHEIIGIHDACSLAEAYNRGIRQASGELLIFSHDDILILDPEFADKIYARSRNFDLLGFVGASRLVNGAWIGAGHPHLHGVISLAKPGENRLSLDVYGAQQWPLIDGIKAIDGLCMIARREVAERIGFDSTHFDGFHLYDLDFSFSAFRAGYRLGVCCDIPIIHASGGNFNQTYAVYADRFAAKHADWLDDPDAPDLRPQQIRNAIGRAGLFDDYQSMLRCWNREFLQRVSIAIDRHPTLPGSSLSLS